MRSTQALYFVLFATLATLGCDDTNPSRTQLDLAPDIIPEPEPPPTPDPPAPEPDTPQPETPTPEPELPPPTPDCSQDPNPCGPNAICTDQPDGFDCTCVCGFTMGDGACVSDPDQLISGGEYLSASPAVLNIDNNPRSEVQFVFHDNCEPLVGATIEMTFESTASGVTLESNRVTTDASGIATAVLLGGSEIGEVIVTATSTDLDTSAVSDPIPVTKVALSSLELTCSAPALEGFHNRRNFPLDQHSSSLCTLEYKTSNTQTPITATSASFRSEGGRVTSPQLFPETEAVEGAFRVGRTNTVVSTSFLSPCGVVPLEDEPSIILDGAFCQQQDRACPTNPDAPCFGSPRNGLMTVMAYIRSHEHFKDLNYNNQRDPGEDFVDQGEPFVDGNDNDLRDDYEVYDDINGNGEYDGPNGVWDAETWIWASARIVVSQEPEGAPIQPDPGTSFVFLPDDPTTPIEGVINVPQGELDTTIGVWWRDSNFNILGPSARFRIGLLGDNTGVTITRIEGPPPPPMGFGFSTEFVEVAEGVFNTRTVFDFGSEPSSGIPILWDISVDEPRSLPLRFTAILEGNGTLTIERDVTLEFSAP